MTLPGTPSVKRPDSAPEMLHQALQRWFEMVNATFVNGDPFTTKSVASILEIDLDATIQYWMALVEPEDELACYRLTAHDRVGHLPQLLRDLIDRLRHPAVTTLSAAANQHGELRRLQGYTPPMLVEEWRLLEISIFTTIQSNLSCVDFRQLLLDALTIADECDSQLKQALLSYVDTVSAWSAA
jgi:hypothetical protein